MHLPRLPFRQWHRRIADSLAAPARRSGETLNVEARHTTWRRALRNAVPSLDAAMMGAAPAAYEHRRRPVTEHPG